MRRNEIIRSFSNKSNIKEYKRVLSGIQPTGTLHIGNYIGALKQWVDNQNNYDNYFCVVDMHAITLPHIPQKLTNETFQAAAIYLAAGIDPKKSKIFIQSHIPAHAELTWILNCLTPLSWLEGMIQFKEKSAASNNNNNSISQGTGVSVGLLDYPVLMASDILLYQANYVPVGEDQRQHLELTRDICRRLNERFDKQLFVEPKNLILSSGSRIMSLTDGKSKMSKSCSNDNSRINLLDPPDVIRNKIKRCKTDSISHINPEYGSINYVKSNNNNNSDNSNNGDGDINIDKKEIERPECENLVGIYRHMTGYSDERIRQELEGLNWGKFKPLLTEAIVEHLRPIQTKYHEIVQDKSYVDEILVNGRDSANEVAEDTLKKVKNAIGYYELRK